MNSSIHPHTNVSPNSNLFHVRQTSQPVLPEIKIVFWNRVIPCKVKRHQPLNYDLASDCVWASKSQRVILFEEK